MVNRRVENFPFGVVRDTLDWDKVYELVWAEAGSGLGARGVLVKWWACVRGCTGFHSAFRVLCFFLCRTGSFGCIISIPLTYWAGI